MAERRRLFAILAFIFCAAAGAFLIASMAAPYWVESDKKVNPSGFERMGLWEMCFRNYYSTIRPITRKRYDGCWPALSYELEDIYDHFFPAWMQGVQAMVTLSVLQEFAAIVINIIYFIHCFAGFRERILVLVAAILNFTSAFFCTISVIMFGVQVEVDRQWLPQPDANFLSWAYGFCILGALLSLLSGMFSTVDFFRLKAEDDSGRVNGRATTYAVYSAPPGYRY